MKTQDFNIGDAVYTLHTDRNNCIFLKYQLVVGVKTKIIIDFHRAHLSTDLAENFKGFIYRTLNIYTNEDGTFSFNTKDNIDTIEDTHIFETQNDARSYLFDSIDKIRVVS